eukprot:m.739766 g.739766  ORF g.739766 m.739766 type:complete len:629 (+) comp23110_c0_seq3:699-2585(+)
MQVPSDAARPATGLGNNRRLGNRRQCLLSRNDSQEARRHGAIYDSITTACLRWARKTGLSANTGNGNAVGIAFSHLDKTMVVVHVCTRSCPSPMSAGPLASLQKKVVGTAMIVCAYTTKDMDMMEATEASHRNALFTKMAVLTSAIQHKYFDARQQKELVVLLSKMPVNNFRTVCASKETVATLLACMRERNAGLHRAKAAKSPCLAADMCRMLNARMKDLSYTARLGVIDVVVAARACQGVATAELLVANFFMGLKGADLARVKAEFDIASGRSLSDIIFNFLSDEGIRKSVLEHFNKQAAEVLRTEGFQRPMVVLCDVDDTVVQGAFGGGTPKYPTGCLFPGFNAVVRTLGARVVFAPTRPDEMQSPMHDVLTEHGIEQPNVLTGLLVGTTHTDVASTKSRQWVTDRKFDHYIKYMNVFPEAQFVWFGNTGQGDVQRGLELLQKQVTEDGNNPTIRQVAGCFVQDVLSDDGTGFKTSQEQRWDFLERGVYVVNTYVDVAALMCKQGFFAPDALQPCVQEAVHELQGLWKTFQHDGHTDVDDTDKWLRYWDARVSECRQAVSMVNALLRTKSVAEVAVDGLSVRGEAFVAYRDALAAARQQYVEAHQSALQAYLQARETDPALPAPY